MSHGAAKPARKFVLVEFDESAALLHATTEVRLATEKGDAAPAWAKGVAEIDTHTPFPVHGLSEAIGIKKLKIPWRVFGSAMTGAGGGFLMMTWMNHIDYAINVGGRPTFSWPTQIPITFELGVLLSGFAAFFGLLAMLGLPRPYHPVFEGQHFHRASVETYFLAVEVKESGDASSIADAVKAFNPRTVEIVEESER